MIYILTLTKVCPGEPTGYISDLWEDCWTDRTAAERAFKKLELGPVYFRKELLCMRIYHWRDCLYVYVALFWRACLNDLRRWNYCGFKASCRTLQVGIA